MSAAIYFARSTQLAARAIAGETMIMSGKDSTLYTLNPTATILWAAADGVTPLALVVEERICKKFDVEPAQALRDAVELVEGLAKEGILLVSDAPMEDAK